MEKWERMAVIMDERTDNTTCLLLIPSDCDCGLSEWINIWKWKRAVITFTLRPYVHTSGKQNISQH